MQNTPITRGDADAKRWANERAAAFGAVVKRRREEAGLSAAELSRRTADVGYPITRGTIAKIEGNHRAGKVDVAEVVTLAAALGVPPIELIYPDMPDGDAELLPGHMDSAWAGAQWFTGEATNDTLVAGVRQYRRRARKIKLIEAAMRNGEVSDATLDELDRDKYDQGLLEQSITEAGGVILDG